MTEYEQWLRSLEALVNGEYMILPTYTQEQHDKWVQKAIDNARAEGRWTPNSFDFRQSARMQALVHGKKSAWCPNGYSAACALVVLIWYATPYNIMGANIEIPDMGYQAFSDKLGLEYFWCVPDKPVNVTVTHRFFKGLNFTIQPPFIENLITLYLYPSPGMQLEMLNE